METSDGKRVGLSKAAAREGIAMVTLSRYIDDDGYLDDHEVIFQYWNGCSGNGFDSCDYQ